MPVIEKANMDQIFDPLKRGLGQGKLDDGGSGLGLGLYIVREIARAHGGEVTARSDKEETVYATSATIFGSVQWVSRTPGSLATTTSGDVSRDSCFFFKSLGCLNVKPSR